MERGFLSAEALLRTALMLLGLLFVGPIPAFADQEKQLDPAEEVEEDFSRLLEEKGMSPSVGTEPDSRLYGVDLKGELRSAVWYQVKDPHEWWSTNRLDLFAARHEGQLRFQGMLKLDYQDLVKEQQARADLRELFAAYRFNAFASGSVDVVVGRQILTWGKGDEIRPLDRICPEDLTSFLYYDKNERKTGLTGLFVTLAPREEARLELFWAPYFQKSRSPQTGDYFEPAALREFSTRGGKVAGDDPGSPWRSDAALGAKLSLSFFRTDVGLYAYRGIDPSPTYGFSKIITQIPIPYPPYGVPIPPTPVEIAPFHPKVSMLGVDFERAVGSVVLRGEAAYLPSGIYSQVKWQENPSLLYRFPQGIEETTRAQYLVGIDKADFLFRNLFLNIQYVGECIFDHESYLVDPSVKHGGTFTLVYSFMNSRFEAMWRLFADFTGGDTQNQLEVSARLAPWARITVGGFLYGGGSDTSLFGQYQDKDFVFTRLSFIF